jgi:2-furoyl-CoA dehydrogenase large subunit
VSRRNPKSRQCWPRRFQAFAQGVAAALYEEFVYDEAGSFLSGTFADYLVPTVSEIPKLEILHQETPSPLTPLGAKGLAEGNCMSTPACIANAVCRDRPEAEWPTSFPF